jgi:hypothetical protein
LLLLDGRLQHTSARRWENLIYYVSFNTFLKRQKRLLLLDGKLQHTSPRR